MEDVLINLLVYTWIPVGFDGAYILGKRIYGNSFKVKLSYLTIMLVVSLGGYFILLVYLVDKFGQWVKQNDREIF